MASLGYSFSYNLLASDVSQMERELLKKHLIGKEDLREATVAFSNAWLGNIEKIENLLDDEYIRNQLSNWGINANQVKTAVRTLASSELQYLVNRSENASRNFLGGAIKGETVGYIVMGSMVAFVAIWEILGWWCVPNWVPLSF